MEGDKHYFVSFTVKNTASVGDEWIPAHGVINRHPFQFIKEEGAPMFAILLDYKEITEEEYFLWDDLFFGGQVAKMWSNITDTPINK